MNRRPICVVLMTFGLIAGGNRLTPAADSLSPESIQKALASKPSGDQAAKLVEDLKKTFGARSLASGAGPKVDGLTVAWAIEAPDAKQAPRVVSDDDSFTLPLEKVGDSAIYAGARTFPNGFAARWAYEVDGKRFSPAKERNGDPKTYADLEVYATPADCVERSDVPKGRLAQQEKFRSKIFEGTSRDWWIYIPAQADGKTPSSVMVFQDGGGYKDFIPTVFDNLIASGDMPVTVGIFLNPGTFANGRSNRSFEYDTLSDQYARFLLEEVLPEVEKKTPLTHDPDQRAIAGISSGGICAWTVAWERPDEFRKVLSWVGSFTNIASGESGHAGGHNYEAMIRKTPKKPIRVFLQDGARDLDNANGNWPLANQQMAKSLAFAGYDYTFVFGEGFHSNKHGRAVLP
ncbi:MAG TPA: alpha/beta hydrolase-fold protein, partial [Isosphaeraceae bacterium]|nr:alpha/beta hydrolase-fold protein [Isosphaeraceae bacterium]